MEAIEQRLAKALALHRAGRLPEAEAIYRDVLKRVPRQPDALHLLGVLLHQSGRAEAGAASIRRAIAVRPSATYYSNLGNALQDLGRYAEAVDCYRQAIHERPRFAEAHNNLGNALAALGETDAAEQAFRRAVEFEPEYAAAHLNLADLLAAAGRGAEALETYRTAVALAPECAEAHCNFGITQRASGDSAAAIESCRRAIELSPELAAAHVNLGNALRDLGRLEEAIVAYQRGVSLAPDAADAHMNLGEAYREAGDPCAAVACQRRAVRLEPDSAEAHYELARALLTIGDFEDGWCEYQWRERMHFASAAREPSTPAISPLRWDGSPLDGRSLLISCHEPLGTQLLFASVLPDLAAQQGRVVLQCEPRLTPLLRRSFAHVDVFDSSEAHDGGALERPMHFDLHSSLGGLPELFRRTPADFPRHGGYLRPDSAKRDDWRKRLADLGERFVVGLSWQAGAAPEERRKRSIPLELWREVAALPEVALVNLHGGDSAEKGSMVAPDIAAELHSWVEVDPFADVDGFAALLAELHLVISADNSTAQLAGALGAAVWTLLPVGADWRWLTERHDSPWFPSMRLFRQPQRGQWSPVMSAVIDALREVLATRPGRRMPRAA